MRNGRGVAARRGVCLDRVDFRDATDVTTTFKRSGEPDFYDVQGFGFGDGTLAEGEAIGIVVLAVPDGDLFVPAEAAADAFDTVGDDGFAVAGAAENDAALDFAAGHGFGDGADEIRVVAARFRVRAKIAHGVAGGQEHGFDGFFVGEASVVGTDGDGEQLGHGGRWCRVKGIAARALGLGRYSMVAEGSQTNFPRRKMTWVLLRWRMRRASRR